MTFNHLEFDNHENVMFFNDKNTGLMGIIGVHNTNLGPGLGGLRIYPYKSVDDALYDVLRLSKGMTYKNALANLRLGGGKAVIILDPANKTKELLESYGEHVNRLNGSYITAEDVGTTVEDIEIIRSKTPFVSGCKGKSGDPSPFTAYGVYVGLKSCVKEVFGRDELSGLTVAIQGLGKVGMSYGELLYKEGVKLIVSDINQEALNYAVQKFGAQVVPPEEIHSVSCDVFSPCALGAVINDETIDSLKCSIIAGAANNQLKQSRHGEILKAKGILYAPDYAINAGGVINVAYEYEDCYDKNKVYRHIETIYDTLTEIFKISKKEGIPTNIAADRLAEEKFSKKLTLA